jgi:hypothetical protein
MRFSQLLWGALAFCLGCGNSGGGGGTTEVPPPHPSSLNVSLAGPSAVADSARFTLTTNGSSNTQFTVKMEDSSVVYQGTGLSFMWKPASSVSGSHTLSPSAVDAGRSASGVAFAVTVSHPIAIRFARTRALVTIREIWGNGNWVKNESFLTLGMFLSTTDSVAGTQTSQMLGDSAYAGMFYNVSTAVLTFHKDEIVKVTASLATDGLCWNLSDAKFFLQRSDSANPGVIKQTAAFSWDELKSHGDTLTVPIGQVGTSSGYIINPIVVLKHKCGNVDDSKVLISSLKIIYIPAVKVDTIKIFAPDSITMTSSRR